jgi:hypothetical protein
MQKIRLVTVTGSRTNTLHHMLNHYNDLVDEIYVVVYEWDGFSTYDSVYEIIKKFPKAKIVKRAIKEKFNWEYVTELYNETKLLHPNDWWVVSDDDEFHIYPKPIRELISDCEENDWEFVTGGFIDRIGENGEFPQINEHTNIWTQFPLAGFFRYPMSGACPNKVCIMKGVVKVSSGQHYVEFEDGTNSWGTKHPKRYPIGRGEGLIQVHHFKWDSTCVERIKAVADIKKEYAFSTEYQSMYKAIQWNDFKIDINNSNFMIEELLGKSYDFNDYSKWNKLTKIITKI